MNYYKAGTSAEVAIVPSRIVHARKAYHDARHGLTMTVHGMTRGGSLSSAYAIGTGRIEVGASKAGNALVDFMLSIAHIVLIGAGLWLLISAVASL